MSNKKSIFMKLRPLKVQPHVVVLGPSRFETHFPPNC